MRKSGVCDPIAVKEEEGEVCDVLQVQEPSVGDPSVSDAKVREVIKPREMRYPGVT
jgi:hypothetical protein